MIEAAFTCTQCGEPFVEAERHLGYSVLDRDGLRRVCDPCADNEARLTVFRKFQDAPKTDEDPMLGSPSDG